MLPLGKSCALALLLGVVAATIIGTSGFSFSRTLHDVEQDVAEDASLYSQEMRLSTPELGLSSSTQRVQRPHLERYVTIRLNPSGYVSVPRGHRLELKCEVDGSPPPQVYWVRGENPGRQVEQLERESVADVLYTAIAREVSKLVIECATPEDQGLIHCVGVSGEKMAISAPTVVNVLGAENATRGAERECLGGPRPPIVTRYRPIYFSEIGSTVVLPCEASGMPRPRVRWLDGESKPLDDPRFTVQANGDLVMSTIRWPDMDGYKCVAESPLGVSEAVTFLYPAAKSETNEGKANAL